MPEEDKSKPYNDSIFTKDGDSTEKELKLLEANKRFQGRNAAIEIQSEELRISHAIQLSQMGTSSQPVTQSLASTTDNLSFTSQASLVDSALLHQRLKPLGYTQIASISSEISASFSKEDLITRISEKVIYAILVKIDSRKSCPAEKRGK
uniref:Uncharacterized protein n=1 Tax=Trichogramma kaykai TaxID=54128 RepID=A0ABD2WHC0_9HYME